MRYLIYSYCFETPHFETELEIALKLKDQGHEVFFLICKADLQTCFVNPDHNKAVCSFCKSKIVNGLNAIGIPENKILNFKKFAVNETFYKGALESLSTLKAFRYKNSDIGLAVASSIISACRDHYFEISKYQDKIKTGLETAIMVHETFDAILKDIKPDGVIMFNGRFLEVRPIMRLCEKMNIEFFTHERGGQLDRYMFRKNSTPHNIAFVKKEMEELWKNGPDDKEEIGRKFFEDRRNKVIQQWHVFTENQVEGDLPAGFDQAKRNIGIFNSSMDEYEGIADFNNKLYTDDNEGIEQICKDFLPYPEFHFYLRVHPNLAGLDNAQNKKIAEIKERYSNLTVIPPDDKIDSYALMEAVEAVISFGSTMGIEAIYWHKPSILLGRAFYENLDGLIKPGNHPEVVQSIKNKKETQTGLSAIKYGYWCLTYGTKFELFKPESLFKGTILGKRITASLLPRLRRKYRYHLDKLTNGSKL